MGDIVVYQVSQVPYFMAQAKHIERLRLAFAARKVVWCQTRDEFLAALPRAVAVISWAFRQEWFALAPHLRCVASNAAGRDLHRLTAPPGVALRYAGFHGPLMAESVLGLMLAFNRGLYLAHRAQLAGALWPREELYGQVRLLRGSHALILGFGKIGQHIGALLKAFGVRVTGCRRNVSALPPAWMTAQDGVIALDELDGVLASVDHLIMVLPADTDTDRIIDARRLALLPSEAVIYNVGRGNALDEEALVAALRAGRLRGACLDVFAQEPLTAHSPLAAAVPGLIRLPHATAFAEAYMDDFLDELIPWLARLLASAGK